MFGYVRPWKPELKMAEFEIYKGIYCGLCKQMGRLYGPISRFMLSYDMTFLALVSVSMGESCGKLKPQICMAHPLKKKTCMCACDDLSFAAHTAMILSYYKVKDNIQDSGFWGKCKYFLALPVVALARRKAKKHLPQVDQIAEQMMREQWTAEQDKGISVDRACDPTAKALASIAEQLGEDDKQRQILQRVGYMLGRYIYLIDALDDLEKDFETGNFNPYLRRFSPAVLGQEEKREIVDYATEVLNLTVAQLAAAYELLEIRRFKPILDNIIYLGLKQSRKLILNKKGETE